MDQKINPLITITTWVRGAIVHKHFIKNTRQPNIPKSNIKALMRNIHQNAIEYLAYLVLNKRKLKNKQAPVLPPPHQWTWDNYSTNGAHLPKEA